MKRYAITDAEWQVLEALWLSPASLMELVRYFGERPPHWSKSTVATLVRRLEEKSLVSHHAEGKTKIFCARVDREDAALAETRGLLEKVFSGSVALLVSTLVSQEAFSQGELEELYKVLECGETHSGWDYDKNASAGGMGV